MRTGHSKAGMHLVWCLTRPVLQKQPSTHSFFSQSCFKMVMPDDVVAYRQPKTHLPPHSWYTSFSGSSHTLCSTHSVKNNHIIYFEYSQIIGLLVSNPYLDHRNYVDLDMDTRIAVLVNLLYCWIGLAVFVVVAN